MANKGSKYPYKKQHPAKVTKPVDNINATDNKNMEGPEVKSTEDKTEKVVESVEKLPLEPEKTLKVENTHNHEEFLKAAQDSLSPDDVAHLEINPNTILQNPILQPKIENDYTTQGIKRPKGTDSVGDTGDDAGDGSHKSENGSNDTVGDTNSGEIKEGAGDQEEGDMQPPVIPGKDEAPTQTTEPKSGEGEPATNIFNIKTESAEQMVDFAFGAANYGIEKFAGKLTDIKVRPAFFRIEGIVQKIEKHNRENVEKLKFSPQEISMVKGPLVDLMKEKGIEGFSSSEKLIAACAMILANKVKVFIEIRTLNKQISSDLSQKIKESDDRINEKMKEMEERLRADFIKNNSEKGEDKKAA